MPRGGRHVSSLLAASPTILAGLMACEHFAAADLSQVRAVLDTAARYRENFMRNFYTMGRDEIKKGESEAPYAYVVSAAQRDPNTAAKMINLLINQGAEVHHADADFTADGIRYPARHDHTRAACAIFSRPVSTFKVSSLGSLMASANRALLNDILTLYNVDLI